MLTKGGVIVLNSGRARGTVIVTTADGLAVMIPKTIGMNIRKTICGTSRARRPGLNPQARSFFYLLDLTHAFWG